MPSKDDAVKPAGADSPEGAMNAVFDAVEQFDLEHLLAVINPNEAEALQRYTPLFLHDAQSALDQAKADNEISIKIDEPDYDVNRHGDSAGVTPTGLHATIESQGASIEVDGECVIVTSPEGDRQSSCDDPDATFEDALGSADLPDSVRTLIEDVRHAFEGFSSDGITVDKVDGQWFVSPIGTSFDFVVSGLEALDRHEIDTLVDDIQNAEQDAMEEIDQATSDDTTDDSDSFPPASTPETDTNAPTDSTVATDVTEGTDTTDGTDATDGSETADAFTVCMSKLDADTAMQCVYDGLADGSVDRSTLPAELRYPECGLSVLFFKGVELLSDDAFVATITSANECFQAKVDSGDLDETEVPLDAAHPECAKGVNPYAASDEVLDVYLDCIGA